MSNSEPRRVALVTGASRGLGRALAAELVRRGWHVVVDARDAARLASAIDEMEAPDAVTAVAGDVSDPAHGRELADAVEKAGGLDLLANNASVLGPSPQPRLADYPLDVLEQVYAVNTIAPVALLQLVLPQLEERGGRIIDVSSDAAVEAYGGLGGHRCVKAAPGPPPARLRRGDP